MVQPATELAVAGDIAQIPSPQIKVLARLVANPRSDLIRLGPVRGVAPNFSTE
jgi:hypothetical protein